MSEFSVSLAKLAEEANLTIAYTPCELEKIQVTATEVYRPGILLAGYYENFDSKRIQIIGLTEMSYLDELTTTLRNTHLEKLFSFQPPAVVLSRGMQPLSEMMQYGKKYGVPILMSTEMTSALMGQLITTLNTELAPRITRHGVLVEVYGEGILILGDSGVGKSETAIELVKRGHRLLLSCAGSPTARSSARRPPTSATLLSCAASASSMLPACSASARCAPVWRLRWSSSLSRGIARRTTTARALRQSIMTFSALRCPVC